MENIETDKILSLLNKAYEGIQSLIVQATSNNINAVAMCLNNVNMAYMLIKSASEQKKEG